MTEHARAIIGFLALVGASLASVATLAQTTPKAALIGILHPGSASDLSPIAALRAFRAGLRALGHVEGQTLSPC